ncbi:MAG: hypothetical protein KF726_25655 [Anaerolineae bacterium]|nr:hypothetical protein [Anaerolineae bacterium]
MSTINKHQLTTFLSQFNYNLGCTIDLQYSSQSYFPVIFLNYTLFGRDGIFSP